MEINFDNIQINDVPLVDPGLSLHLEKTTVHDQYESMVYLGTEVVNTFPELEKINVQVEILNLEEIPVPPVEVVKEDVQDVVEEIVEEESKPIFSSNEKMILLFDVDGTLCPSGQEVEEEIKRMILQVKSKYECDLGVVGASSFDKIERQLGKEFLKEFVFVFAECGSMVYNKERKILLKNNLRKHKLYSNLQKCMKHSLRFISEASYEIGGHFMDIRNGLVYISLVGMDASFEMREHFKKMDQRMGFRKRLLLQLNERCDKGVRVVYGGETGITMYPKEWDKVQVLGYLRDYPVIHYFGDRYEEDGNDYQLIHHPKVIGHKVDSVNDTFEFLKSIL
jgi:phosphomannomutase